MKLLPFTFDSSTVRTILRDGEPWFHAADVCAAMGHSNPSDAVKTHVDEQDQASVSLGLPGSPPTFVNESGLYALVFGSTVPGARRFRRWVTDEVIPSIRKSGGYGLPETMRAYLDDLHARLTEADRMTERATDRIALAGRFTASGERKKAEAIASAAEQLGLDPLLVAQAHQTNALDVMATVVGDPRAIEQRKQIAADTAARAALLAPAKKTARRKAKR
ncbi:BRO-N domain-containing protein [Variovorax soli]|uniref:BRO-N domain-containing protein n=1 Tax=Variovorax soli TaxID=376815 RepID=UPI00083867AA|nr:BRO family protein [Variovorax soli]